MRTEDLSPRFRDLDLWHVSDMVDAVVEQQLAALAVVCGARDALVNAVEAAVAALEVGTGRLVYVGAGASGRLAVQDGVELPPTYGWPAARLLYLIAGGEGALTRSVEAAEDDGATLVSTFDAHRIGMGDVVIAVAASGRTPFAVEAASRARALGAVAIGIANNPETPLLAAASHPIPLPTGPEVVAGSTRMAAGTAQKAALNALSTAIMVRLGRTYGNLMVDLTAQNAKLDARRIAILRTIVEVDDGQARTALAAADGHVKTAALMAMGDDAPMAQDRLARHRGRLRDALAELLGQKA